MVEEAPEQEGRKVTDKQKFNLLAKTTFNYQIKRKKIISNFLAQKKRIKMV